MIRLLMDCFDKKGRRYKAISFDGSKYQCQSYSNGQCYYFSPSEISSRPFKRHQENKFNLTDVVAKKEEPVSEPVPRPKTFIPETVPEETVIEPFYEEPKYISEEKKNVSVSQDNVEETADDFYADL